MRCGVCNYAPVAKTTTSIEEWDGDDLIVIKDVPIEKCPQCGEEYFAPDVLEKLEALLERRHRAPQLQPETILKVPVFKFTIAA